MNGTETKGTPIFYSIMSSISDFISFLLFFYFFFNWTLGSYSIIKVYYWNGENFVDSSVYWIPSINYYVIIIVKTNVVWFFTFSYRNVFHSLFISIFGWICTIYYLSFAIPSLLHDILYKTHTNIICCKCLIIHANFICQQASDRTKKNVLL